MEEGLSDRDPLGGHPINCGRVATRFPRDKQGGSNKEAEAFCSASSYVVHRLLCLARSPLLPGHIAWTTLNMPVRIQVIGSRSSMTISGIPLELQ